MPHVLNPKMTELEILNAVMQAYAEASNYEPYEKDYGSGRNSSGIALREAWIKRDAGAYARQAQGIIADKGNAPPGSADRVKELFYAKDYFERGVAVLRRVGTEKANAAADEFQEVINELRIDIVDIQIREKESA